MIVSEILTVLLENKGDCIKIVCTECPFSLLCELDEYLTDLKLYELSIQLYLEIYGKESLMEELL